MAHVKLNGSFRNGRHGLTINRSPNLQLAMEVGGQVKGNFGGLLLVLHIKL
jgi:hypothetical protein